MLMHGFAWICLILPTAFYTGVSLFDPAMLVDAAKGGAEDKVTFFVRLSGAFLLSAWAGLFDRLLVAARASLRMRAAVTGCIYVLYAVVAIVVLAGEDSFERGTLVPLLVYHSAFLCLVVFMTADDLFTVFPLSF